MMFSNQSITTQCEINLEEKPRLYFRQMYRKIKKEKSPFILDGITLTDLITKANYWTFFWAILYFN